MEESSMSRVCNVLSTISTLLQIGFSMISTILLGHVSEYFHHFCPLFANVTVIRENVRNITEVRVLNHQSEFSAETVCWASIFIPCVHLALSIILLWYRIHMNRIMLMDGVHVGCMLPKFVLYFCMSCLLLYSTDITSKGSRHFCENLKEIVNKIAQPASCSELQKYLWTISRKQRKVAFITFWWLAEISNNLLTTFVVLEFLAALCYLGLIMYFSEDLELPRRRPIWEGWRRRGQSFDVFRDIILAPELRVELPSSDESRRESELLVEDSDSDGICYVI